MAIIVFQHHPNEGPAMLGAALQHDGHRLRIIRLYDGDSVPDDLNDTDGVVSMGGPMNVDQADQHPWIEREMRYLKIAHESGVPIVGICLGAQLIAAALGGKVAQMSEPEIGWHLVNLSFPGTTNPIFTGITWRSDQFHIHGQEVTQLPKGSVVLAGSEKCKAQAFRVGQTTYAFQYHFEWDLNDLKVVARDPFIDSAGLSGEQILQEANEYYDPYRRLGDRLSHTIAMTLFPIAARV